MGGNWRRGRGGKEDSGEGSGEEYLARGGDNSGRQSPEKRALLCSLSEFSMEG